MASASALFTTVELKKETSFGVKDTDTDNAILLKRVSFNPKLDQSIIESAEIKRSMQTSNYDRGVKAATATLKGELESGSYKELWQALLRQDFNTNLTSSITGASDIDSFVQVSNLTSSSSDFISALDAEAGDEIQISFESLNGTSITNSGNNTGRWIVLNGGAAAGALKLREKYGYKVMKAIAANAMVLVNIRNRGQTGNVKDIFLSSANRYACVADEKIFTTVSSDFTVPFDDGDTIKVDGFTGGNIANNDKLFKITQIDATNIFGYYTDGSLPASDTISTSVSLVKYDNIKTTYSATNKLTLLTATKLYLSSGSFISEGFKVHDVIRLSGFPTSTNNSRNLLITSFSDTTYEEAVVTFAALTSGETVILGGRTITAGSSGATAVQVATAFITGTSVTNVTVVTGTLSGWAVFVDSSSTSNARFISTTTANVTDLADTGTNVLDVTISKTDGGVTTNGCVINFVVLDTDTTAMVPESAGSGDYVYRVGAKTYIPQENHTNKSYMAEKWFSDTTQSERYTGLRVGTAKISAPNSAIPTVDFDFMGKDVETAQAHYYTTSSEPDSSGNLSTIFGSVYVGNTAVACITAFDLSVTAGLSALDKCIGSDTANNIVAGIYKVSGSMTLYFEDEVMRDRFLNKNELSQVFVLRESDDYDADFIAFQLPRIVYNSAALTDDVKASVLTIPFTAFENLTGDDGTDASKIKSMISIQDSKA